MIDHGRVIAAGTPLQLKSRVGAQVLSAQPENEADVPATEKLLADLAGSDEPIHTDGRVVAVTVEDRSLLAKAIVLLDEAGILVDDLSLRRPSLDEVFLALTGHMAEESADEESNAERPTQERSRA